MDFRYCWAYFLSISAIVSCETIPNTGSLFLQGRIITCFDIQVVWFTIAAQGWLFAIFFPVESISNNKEKIESGDIVVFATSLQGLDYSHIGIAYWQNGELHFIHASSKQKQVVIEKKTLVEYCVDSKSCSGISILRINN